MPGRGATGGGVAAAEHPRRPDGGGTVTRVPSVPDLEERALGLASGLDGVGVAPATPFVATRRHLSRPARRPAARRHGLHLAEPGALHRSRRGRGRARPRCRRPPITQSAPPAPAGPAGRVALRLGRPLPTAADGLWAVARRLKLDGWRAVVFADDNSLVDREAAYRAGLGWYGKNANVLLPGLGSWFVLGAVVTDAPLAPATAPVEDGCGPCRRCLDGCPTDAIVAPGVVDARRCLAWLVQQPGSFPVEYRQALGPHLWLRRLPEVCPPNRRAERWPAARPPLRRR